jgi:glycosyltransferase involved in cell wall biosynthesis
MPLKKIFITIPWFVPAFRAGGPVQSVANLVNEFTEGVEYFIFCADVDLNGAQLENVQAGKWITYNENTKVWYAAPGKISDTLVKQVELQKPDILFIIGLFSWHFNIVPMLFCKGPRKILSTRGMLHPGALAQKKWKKKLYLLFFKLLEYHYNVDFHATDSEEARYIQNYFGEPAKVFVAGNFPNKLPPLPLPGKETGKLRLVTVAIISPMKNILLVLQALEKPEDEVQYDIYGPIKDEDYWYECNEQIKKLPQNVTVQYHREVEQQKVAGVLQRANVFILPSESENFGHAIYEALSAGRPVITSHNTPWNDLKELKAGINVSPDSGIELSEAIGYFARMDLEELEQWSRGASGYAEGKVDMEEIRRGYGEMFGGKG